MADMLDDGKSVRLGDFGLFRPTITGKSADNEEDVTANNIVRRRIVFTPGKIFQSTLDNMSVTRAVTPDIDWTDKSSSTGSNSSSSNNSGNTEGGDDELDPLG
jgi:predicted histone-like DNA-binding protein